MPVYYILEFDIKPATEGEEGMEVVEGLKVDIKREIIDKFHDLYYSNKKETWLATKWRGVFVAKCPLDLWVYQEIIQDTQPDIIIETGTAFGGSALYLKDILHMHKSSGKVITIDTNPLGHFKDEDGVIQLVGDSISPIIVNFVKSVIDIDDKVMVILDSDHSQGHVLKELNIWASFVSKGCYLIVEDTNVNGHPVNIEHGPGPMEALEEWLPSHPEFGHDIWRERLLLTFNPNGYYKRS